jgi:hypothetical protein
MQRARIVRFSATFKEGDMLRFTRFLIFLSAPFLVVFAVANAQSPQRDNRPRAASIGGQVAIGGRPAANVTVKIVEVVLGTNEFFSTSVTTAVRESRTFNSVTDAGGRYRLAGLAAGAYRVSAASNAYVLANQNSDFEPAKGVTLDGDEAREDVDFSLVRGGAITGRVTTSDGRPLIATRVWLYAVVRQGDRTEYRPRANQSHQMFETDDRGVYRIYGLPAGRCILSAGGAESLLSSRDPARDYTRTYFRGAESGNKATIIEVKEGGEIADVDIELGAAKKTYEASGRLVEAETGTPIPQAQIWSLGSDKKGEEDGEPHDTIRDMKPANAVTDSQGNFRLTDLTPGRYKAGYRNSWKNNEYYSDPIAFEIVDDDVAGLEIKAIRAGTISGVAVIEGAVDPNLRRLLFTPDAINVDTIYFLQDGQSTTRMPITEIKPNGEFLVSVSRQGSGWKVYFVANQRKVKGLRVSRVERNGVEAPGAIEANPGQQITGVRVVFTQASGMIRGRVKIVGAPPEIEELTVIATSLREGEASSRDGRSTETAADGKGRFVFDGLSPGVYAVGGYLRFRSDSHTASTSTIELSPQRVTVTNDQETPVELTIDLNKPGREK